MRESSQKRASGPRQPPVNSSLGRKAAASGGAFHGLNDLPRIG